MALHALRIKGFATTDTIAEVAAVDSQQVNDQLVEWEAAGWVRFREGRNLWQLTDAGRAEHARLLALDNQHSGALVELKRVYPEFLVINDEFKQLCTDWQVRAGDVNDHADPAYDTGVIERLRSLHAQVLPVLATAYQALARLEPYHGRLESTLDRLCAGDTSMFTGVMCGSYHDVWMELHEDLILTQGIDRSTEGSF